MARRSRLSWVIAVHRLFSCLSQSHAQSISTSTPVPPLQWLNITGLLQGSPAPPLKYASIGYDDTTRNLIIFGGQASSGIPTAQTFLLNLGTNQWSTPTSQSDLPKTSPPARYMAISGDDFSSSYRHAHLVIGGKNGLGQALSDAWEFDYINQFWSEVIVSPGSPSPRWSASGGRDYRTPADAASTNTTFYMTGGTDGTTMFPLTDVWEFRVTGTLSSNLATNNTFGSWSAETIGTTLGYSVNQASTVLGSSIVSVSGCNATTGSDENCAQSNTYVVTTGSSPNEIALQACPAPRYGAAMVPNPLSTSSNFKTQVFLLLGTFNSSAWDDQGGLQKGEVAILDTQTGSWSRVLPAGDPGTSGDPVYPTPRQGAAALSYGQALVGSNRQLAADTIVFGGEDENGNYLNEVWILRAYNGSLSSSNASWGAPTGSLQTGINANGAGVTVQYLTHCAVSLETSTPAAPTATSPTYSQSSYRYDVSFVHKLFAPLSVALVLPAILLIRLALPSIHSQPPIKRNARFLYSSVLFALVAYGLGVGSLVTSFTTIRASSSVAKRTTSTSLLRTTHGVAGLVLSIGLYVVFPLLCLLVYWTPCTRPRKEVVVSSEAAPSRSRTNSVDTAEKLASVQQTPHSASSPASPRTRLHSWGGSSFWLGGRSTPGRASSDSESVCSAGPQRAFEVLNRPARTRRVSTNGIYPNIDAYQRVPVTPRGFSDQDWSERRRSRSIGNHLECNAHGTRMHATASGSTPNTTDMRSTGALVPTPRHAAELPSPLELCVRSFFYTIVFGLCILSLVALWHRAPIPLFVVFLLWTVLFYVALFFLAWHGRPAKSLLTTLIVRVRAESPHTVIPPGTPGSRPLSMAGTEQYLFSTDTRGPYLHHPPYRAAVHDDLSMTPMGPRSVETDDDDDDIDEDTRQRQIEEEMGRREVSIVTVPRRRLWITNPS